MSRELPRWFRAALTEMTTAPVMCHIQTGDPERPLLVPQHVLDRFGLVPVAAELHRLGVQSWQIIPPSTGG